MIEPIKNKVRSAFDAGIKASMPAAVLEEWLPRLDVPPTAILAIGKAAGPMAEACRRYGLTAKGLLITHDPSVQVDGFDVFVGGHPVPNEGSLEGARAALQFVQGLSADDHLLILLSGGGSALMTLPQEGLSLDDKMMINEALLKSGMDIHQINAIRRLVSQVKGGRLARAAMPARITQWAMSDVPATGDSLRDLSAIASGPFAADPVPLEETLKLILQAGLDSHEGLRRYLEELQQDQSLAPVRLGDPALVSVTTDIIASNDIALKAAADHLGGDQVNLPILEGEASEMGARFAELVMNIKKPITAASGGETVVTFSDDALSNEDSLGGRSQELALAFLVAMSGYHAKGHDIPNFCLLAGGTDGRDGPTDAAGAMVSHEMIAHGADLEQMRDALMRHDSYRMLAQCDALIKMPPTGTNLGDLVLLKAW